MSKFLAFAHPVSSPAEAKEVVAQYQKKYHDARHVCWAYMCGPERKDFLSSDNGEPSGTAGKPILGQINSLGLTDVVVVVVRYFGGIKLGTSGLIVAYREAARMALEEAPVKECRQQRVFSFTFPYMSMNAVMKLTKNDEVSILEQIFDNTCSMSLSVPLDSADALHGRLEDIDGLTFIE